MPPKRRIADTDSPTRTKSRSPSPTPTQNVDTTGSESERGRPTTPVEPVEKRKASRAPELTRDAKRQNTNEGPTDSMTVEHVITSPPPPNTTNQETPAAESTTTTTPPPATVDQPPEATPPPTYTWTVTKLTPKTDSEFARDLEPSDEKTIADAVEQATNALAKARETTPNRKAVLYLGVGVGNPKGGWGNPSMSEKVSMDDQVNPPFLQDMAQKGYFVVGMNFNVDSTPQPPALPPTDGVHLHVPARFPLTENSSKETVSKLTELRRKCDRVVALNAVSQNPYPTLLTLGSGYAQKVLQTETHVPAAYVSSYGETGQQASYARFGLSGSYVQKDTELAEESDVFPRITDLDM